MAERLVTTYSIVACDLDARRWGVATQSKFLGVGSIVPWAEAEVGAIATQSYANPRYGDDGREHRQVGVVDARGGSATFTGGECHDWAGGRIGEGYAAQGNILVSEETVDALAETFEATAGKPLEERLLDCLDAAQAAGGDSRGQQSAALLVVEKDGGYAGLWDVVFDLRVDDHPRPLEDLRRLHGLHVQLFGETPRDEWLPVDAELAAELRDRLARLGFESELAKALPAWAGQENLEERVDGAEAIDPVVLEQLRRQS